MTIVRRRLPGRGGSSSASPPGFAHGAGRLAPAHPLTTGFRVRGSRTIPPGSDVPRRGPRLRQASFQGMCAPGIRVSSIPLPPFRGRGLRRRCRPHCRGLRRAPSVNTGAVRQPDGRRAVVGLPCPRICAGARRFAYRGRVQVRSVAGDMSTSLCASSCAPAGRNPLRRTL